MASPPLTTAERDVLSALAQSGTVASVVTLAADLWRTGPEWSAFDVAPFVGFALEALAERGLVTYREGNFRSPFIHTVRLTPEGWALAGYPDQHHAVGSWSSMRQHLPKRGDLTNYRRHSDTAEGGPIETQDFPTHWAAYPHHIHDYGDIDMTTQEKRKYVRVTPEIEGTVLAVHEALGVASTYDEVAARSGIPARTVKYILVDLPRLRRAEAGDAAADGSLKSRVYDLIETIGEVKDVPELRRLLGMSDDEHSILHVLHSLHTQGRIDFTERGNGMGNATAVNIHLAKRGPKPKQVEPEPGEIAGGTDHASEPEPQSIVAETGYPLLRALAEREWRRLDGDSKANAYLTAATALEHVDPDTARGLMEKAEAHAEPFPSPIEAEYLRYATANPAAKEG